MKKQLSRYLLLILTFVLILTIYIFYPKDYINSLANFNNFANKTINLLKNNNENELIYIKYDEFQIENNDYYIEIHTLQEKTDITIENYEDFYLLKYEQNEITIDLQNNTIIKNDELDILDKTYFQQDSNLISITITQELGFNINYTSDGITLSRPYGSKRLIVKSEKEIKYDNAIDVVNGYKNISIIQYATEQDTQNAFEYYKSLSYIDYVEVDSIMQTDEISYSDNLNNTNNEQINLNFNNFNLKYNNYSLNNTINNYYSLNWGYEDCGFESYFNILSSNENNLREVIVAVLDTGIDSDHSWFDGRIAVGGQNFSTSQSSTNYTYEDGYGHGTHVAGIICQSTYSNVKILPIKVLDNDGYGYTSNIILGMEYVIELKNSGYNIYVMNMSLGGESAIGSYYQTAYEDSIENAYNNGIITVVSSGNDGANVENYSPANVEKAITVGAVGKSSNGYYRPYWSNYGKFVDIVAPGCDIESAYIGGGTTTLSGTSMACPYVSGAICLLISNPNQSINFSEIENKLIKGALDLGNDNWDKFYGYGLLNIEYANYTFEGEITFSENSQNQSQPFYLSLSTNLFGALIYYTLDGSKPNISNGTYYQSPIKIDKSTQVRAQAFYFSSSNGNIEKVSSLCQMTYVFPNQDIENAYVIDSTGTIITYNGVLKDIEVPSEINGINVVKIGQYAFSTSSIENIVLPTTVTKIDDYAFAGNETLQNITAPSVTEIGISAFEGCYQLKEVSNNNFPNLKTIGKYAFYKCYGIIENIVLDNVEIIEDYAFNMEYYNANIQNLSLLNVTSIGKGAFYGFNIQSINLPKVQTICAEAFYDNTTLSNLNVPQLIYLGRSAFNGNTSLQAITMPNLLIICSQAFQNCSNLSSAEIENVTTIANKAFYQLPKLTNIYMPNVEKIYSQAFTQTSITNLDCPKLKEVHSQAFYSTDLTNINLPAIETIETQAFYYNTQLEQINLSSVLNYIGSYAFGYSPSDAIFNIYNGPAVDYAISNNLKYNLIDNNSQFIYIVNENEITLTGINSTETFIEIPAYIEGKPVTKIASSAFENCNNIKEICLPNLKEIESRAFMNCQSLKSISFENVEKISESAFENCINLTNIEIPQIKIIENFAFNNCENLKNVTLNQNISYIGEKAFGYSNNQKIENFIVYGYTNTEASVYCLENSLTFIEISEQLPYFYYEFYFNNETGMVEISISYVDKNFVGSFKLPSSYNGITISKIGESAFEDCNFITEIILPETIKTIDKRAFYNCENLVNINLENVTSIGESAFANCINLKEVSFDRLDIINARTFENCANLQIVNAPKVSLINQYAFQNCNNIETIVLTSVETIKNNAFDNDFELVLLPNIKTLEMYALKNAKKVVIGKNFNYSNYIASGTPFSLKTIIYGYKDSKAEEFANKYGNEFIAIDDLKITKNLENNIIVGQNYELNLSIEATGFQIKYEWYQSTQNSYTGNIIENTSKNTSNSLNIDTNYLSIYYYYVKLTNWDGAELYSNICKVEIGNVFTITFDIVGEGSLQSDKTIVDGKYLVGQNDDITLCIINHEGYHLQKLVIDNVELTENELNNVIEKGIIFSNITQNHSIYIEFSKNLYNLNIIQSEGGIISSDKEIYYYGDSAILTFTTKENYYLESILINQEEITEIEKNQFIIAFIDKDYTITANFNYIENVSYTINHYIELLEPDDFMFYETETIITNYSQNKQTQAEAKNYTGFTYQPFEQQEINKNGSTVVNIYYTRNIYSIVIENTEGIISTSGSGNYKYEMQITLSCKIDNNYIWYGWVDENGNLLYKNQTTNIIVPAYSITLYPKTVAKTYTIDIKSSSNGEISNEGTQIVNIGNSFTCYFNANEGYHIAQILIDSQIITGDEFEEITNNGYYTFENVTKNHTIEILFAINTYKINILQQKNGTISIEKEIYEYGENAVITITANTGYIIKYLIINDEIIEINKTNFTYNLKNISEDNNVSVIYDIDKSVNDDTPNNDLFKILLWICISLVGVSTIIMIYYLIKRKRIY